VLLVFISVVNLKLYIYSSVITMMHGPTNIKYIL
jgi:hypothetical protein